MKLTIQHLNRVLLAAAILVGGTGAAYSSDDSNMKLSTNTGATQFGFQNSSSADVVTVSSNGGVFITSNTIVSGTTFYANGLVLENNGTPGISGAATAECQSSHPTLGAGSNNYFGTVTCNTSTTQSAGIVATITPTVAAPHQWVCTVLPESSVTGGVVTNTEDIYVVGAATTWTLESFGSFANNKTYVWSYVCGAI